MPEQLDRSDSDTAVRPVVGMAGPPRSLNPFEASNAYAATMIEAVYSQGVVTHPSKDEVIPWAFESWDLKPENAGTGDPTIVARLRDDLTWNDGGGAVTAADVAFTINYAKEHETSGFVAASDFASVEEVTVDRPGGQTVNYFLSEPDCAWATKLLGNQIVPKHVWENVSDPAQRTPLSEGGPVGSGPFRVTDHRHATHEEFELTRRDRDAIPWNELEYTDWLREGGPFVDGLVVRIYEQNDAREAALLNGKIDQPFGPIEIDAAERAREEEHLELRTINDDGWGHISFNTRRVPFDDVAFRQFLVKLMDHTAVVEDFYHGIGALKGTYVTPAAYEDWRPPEPTETDEYEGIPVPNLTFPGNSGEFTLDDAHVREAWNFLLNHEEAVHNYSLGSAVTDLTDSPDEQELYVDGEPFVEAHTDNAGSPGQGPVRVSRNPPDDEPTPRVEAVSGWINALARVGVPVESDYQTWAEQSENVYREQTFDAYERGWDGISANNDHLTQLFSSAGARLDDDPGGRRYRNTMGYTGADELITEQQAMMDPQGRKPIVKRVLAQIWHDAPTLVQEYIKNLQPVTTAYTGRVQTVGGVNNKQTWLNVRPTE